MAIATILALLAVQDTEIVRGMHQGTYSKVLIEYDNAIVLMQSDLPKALQLAERIFDNNKIEKRDRRITIERPMAGPPKTYDFFPYQLRGRIRLMMSKTDPENAATLLVGAVSDLKTSVDAGVRSSEEPYKNARNALDRLKTVKPPDPPKDNSAEKAFREAWQKLIDDHKWKSAREFIDAKGTMLSPDAKRSLIRDTEDRCHKAVTVALDEFLKALEYNSRPALLRQQRPGEFNRAFGLPAEADLIVSLPELDWARNERALLERLRASEFQPKADAALPLLEDLIARLLETEVLEKNGEDWWFRASGQLAVHYLEEVVHGLAVRSKDSAPGDGRKLREAAERATAKWSEALSKVPKDFLIRNPIHDNPKRLAGLLEEFPVDSAEVDKIDVSACFLGASPDLALEQVISDLSKIRDQQESRLSKESARKLLTQLVAATAAHELLAGKTVEEVTKGLQEVGRSLTKVGGPIDPELWGPRIEKIFTALK